MAESDDVWRRVESNDRIARQCLTVFEARWRGSQWRRGHAMSVIRRRYLVVVLVCGALLAACSSTPQGQANSPARKTGAGTANTASSSPASPTSTTSSSSAPPGPGWANGGQLGNLGVASVSCPSPSFCMAVGAESLTTADAFTYSDGTWSTAHQFPDSTSLNAVSCASSSFCVATENVSGTVLLYSDGNWSAPDQIANNADDLDAISCPSPSFCMAGAAEGDIGDQAFLYSNGTWSNAGLDDQNGSVVGVSCPSPSLCMAVDGVGYASMYSGGTWSDPVDFETSDSQTLPSVTGVSCASSNFCMAVDASGNGFIYSGGNWSAPDQFDTTSATVDSVSCPSPSFCMTVDNSGNVFIYSNGTWSAAGQFTTTLLGKATVRSATVSSASSTFCVAGGVNHDAYSYS